VSELHVQQDHFWLGDKVLIECGEYHSLSQTQKTVANILLRLSMVVVEVAKLIIAICNMRQSQQVVSFLPLVHYNQCVDVTKGREAHYQGCSGASGGAWRVCWHLLHDFTTSSRSLSICGHQTKLLARLFIQEISKSTMSIQIACQLGV